jgi:penicillin G amidase
MKLIRRSLIVLILLALIGIGTVWWLLHGSLARLDGEGALPGLTAPVTVTRDALGTVGIDAANAEDMARALGFVHAQERYFQMDLLRRMSAGELSELVGAAALPLDRRHRAHRFRHRAVQAIAALSAAERGRIDAYRDGVNAGLAALRTRPWEYFALRQQPAPWRSEDSALVIYAMFFDLNSDGANLRELNLARMRAALPAGLVDFLVQPGSEWDAPLTGAALPAIAMPGAEVIDLRTLPSIDNALARLDAADLGRLPGSNNFAVAGALTDNGAALVADDMHLGLGVPCIWFRAQLQYTDAAAEGGKVQLNGVTLPGVPGLVAGSNGHIAWGFTNSYGDWTDWARVERDATDPKRYRNATGFADIVTHRETLHVARAADEFMLVEYTEWGPILAKDADGTDLALKWTAHEPRAINMQMFEIDHVRSAGAALALAPTFGMPAQNFVVGDRDGHIGWTLTGNAIPLRTGFDGQSPVSFADAGVGWQGWLAAADYPRIIDPEQHRLWSANARTVDGDWLALEGDGGFDLGARQQQIRDGLFAEQAFDPQVMLAIQLDDRAIFLKRWHELLQEALKAAPEQKLVALRTATADWTGNASVASVDYRMTRAFRLNVIESVMAPFEHLVKQKYEDFSLPSAQGYEAAVWAMIEARAAHLLDAGHADWNALLIAAAERVETELSAQPGGLAARSWGERNTSNIHHPLSSALPGFLARHIDMPRQPLPGDNNMPRVQSPDFGASQRFAIAPGHEDQAYLMMPGGQSPHPLSPFHRAGHDDWASGVPTPLLPGAERHRLILR